MSRPAPPDAAERLAALNVSESFIVRAPAGAGKTTLLTQRCLALLACVDEPEHIVAITFTRKAAAEMRTRIVGALNRALAGEQDATAALARKVLARDAERGWKLVEDPQRLRIETIDALSLRIAQARPLESGIGPGIRIAENADDFYRLAVRTLFEDLEQREQWSESLAQLLAALDNNVARIEQLLITMLACRDQWQRLISHGDLRGVVTTNVERAVGSMLRTLRNRLPAHCHAELIGLARQAGAEVIKAGGDSRIAMLADMNAIPGIALADVPLWQALAELLLTQSKQGGWRKSLTVKQGFPAGSASKDAKERMLALIETLAEVPQLDGFLNATRTVPVIPVTDDAWQLLGHFMKVLVAAIWHLEPHFVRRGEIDFIQVAMAAQQVLGRPEDPSELALLLDHRVSHLLIDEFQDTSFTQYDLIGMLTAGWQGNDGRTLFLVGDPLQSIYRFREANVSLFERTWREQRFGSVQLTPLSLQANFRSQAGLIEWLNHWFDELDLPPPVTGVTEVAYTACTAQADLPVSSAVHFHLAEAAEGDHIERLADLVQTLREKAGSGTIAVLARSRTHVAGLASVLRARGVQCQAEGIEAPGQRAAIRDLIMLTRAILHGADDIAWLAILRAPWCGLTLRDLTLLTADSERNTIAECVLDQQRWSRLDPVAVRRLARVAVALKAALVSRETDSLAGTVERCWQGIDGPACLVDAEDHHHVLQFFSLLAGVEHERRRLTPTGLQELAQRLPAMGGENSAGAVILTTVHKAKGLEYDYVVIPESQRRTRGDDQSLLLWSELVLDEGEPALVFAALPHHGATDAEAALYRYIANHEQLEGVFELRRLLYVALTRARREVHVCGTLSRDKNGTVQTPPANSLLRLLWPIVSATTTVPASPEAVESNDVRSVKHRMLARLPIEAFPVRALADVMETPTSDQPAALAEVEYDWAGIAARYAGTVVHEWLHRIAMEGVEAWSPAKLTAQGPAIVNRLAMMGVTADALDEVASRVHDALLRAIGDARGAWLLSGGHTESAAELRVSGRIDGTLADAILDRTFVDDQGIRWIVDYKTSRHVGGGLEAFLDSEQQRYAPQLERYAALMRPLDQRPIMLGLYFPLLLAWRSWQAPV
ncbi:MAG: UvrD-helicase domain-containing protein [Gammaproteobacteria bacterium]|nr:UvrD-helicase domain-containing protein [Gammaproteobacteria bacterium]